MEITGQLVVNIFDLLGFVQGTLLGIIFLFSYKRNHALPFLGVFLLGYSLEFLPDVLEQVGPDEWSIQLMFFPVRFYWLFMPALYLYAKSITQSLKSATDYLHFLPGLVEFIVLAVLTCLPFSLKAEWGANGTADTIHLIHIFISMVLITTYSVIVIRFIQRHRRKVVFLYSNIQDKNLRWVSWIAAYVLLTVVNIFLDPFIQLPVFANHLISIVNVVFIFWVALSGFKQLYVNLSEEEDQFPKTLPERLPDNSADLESDLETLRLFVEQERPYINPQLSLKEFAQQLNLPQRQVSELINSGMHRNFNQFINHYRVEEAKRLLCSPEFDHLNILGIAYEAGFSSKSNFNTTFKSLTEQTPSAFKKNRREVQHLQK